MSLIETPKYNQDDCVKEFIRDLIQGSGVENFRKYSLNGELDQYHIRGMAWKIFMEVLPETETLDQWVDTLYKLRKDFKKKLEIIKPQKKFKGDPLSGMSMDTSGNASWNTYYVDNDTKKLINLDLDRTFQELAVFHNNKIKSKLADILFLWNKENQDVGYQQGMNDILAVIFLALYPCYFKNDKKINKDEIIKSSMEQISAINGASDIYLFFHDEDDLQSDLYYCFSQLMKRGLKELFDTAKGANKVETNYRKYELFSNQWEHDPSDDLQNPLNIRCTLIIKEKLKTIDPDLYQHFKKIGLNCSIFLQRWLKCIFDREFELSDVFPIWDAVFATPDTQNYGLVFIDYIALSMILRIRNDLLKCDQNECFMTLFKYPKIEKISTLIIFSAKLQQAVEAKILGKQSEFLDELLGHKNLNNQNNNNNNQSNNNNNIQNEFMQGNFAIAPSQDYNEANNNNDNKTGDATKFFKNAMSSMGGFFSNMKNKFKGEEKNNENAFEEKNGEIKSLKDSAQRISNVVNKYKAMMAGPDINEFNAIIQYLNNYNYN